MSPPAFRFAAVDKAYRSRMGDPIPALSGFDLTGETGAVTCLLGPTGCGKTTALRLAAGLEHPDRGSVHVGAAGRVAYMPQQHHLMPWLRLIENVALPARWAGRARRERESEAAHWLELVGLGPYRRLYPGECSGGMLQRGMLALQLATGATHWLMDEPFSALDERTRFALQDLLLELRRERGLSILYVTHSVEEAVYLADRVCVLSPSPGRTLHCTAIEMAPPRDRLCAGFGRSLEALRQHLESALLT